MNQVINARMCKRQHVRWTPRGTRLLFQVRCAVIDGDLAEKFKLGEAANAAEAIPELLIMSDQLNRAAALNPKVSNGPPQKEQLLARLIAAGVEINLTVGALEVSVTDYR